MKLNKAMLLEKEEKDVKLSMTQYKLIFGF
jgi:hypothetical protein